MLAVGARWETKRWRTTHFAALAAHALKRFGGSVILLGGPDDRELSQAVAQSVHFPVLDLTEQTTLPELAAVLARADVVIANDSGPLHLAAALGRPVVAPYTCTKIVGHGPYSSQSGAVESRVWCQGSYLAKCSRLECMTELTPERLWPALEEVLMRWQSSCRSA